MHPPIHLASFFLPFIYPCLRPVLIGLPLWAGSHPLLLRCSGALGRSRGAELETGGWFVAGRSSGCQEKTAWAPSNTCGAAFKGFYQKVNAGDVATAPRMGALSFCLDIQVSDCPSLSASKSVSVCLSPSPYLPSPSLSSPLFPPSLPIPISPSSVCLMISAHLRESSIQQGRARNAHGTVGWWSERGARLSRGPQRHRLL